MVIYFLNNEGNTVLIDTTDFVSSEIREVGSNYSLDMRIGPNTMKFSYELEIDAQSAIALIKSQLIVA